MNTGSERVSIGGFELFEKIGQGAMGAVYRASQVSIGRIVALKVMRPALARDKQHLERFLREARASAKLSHPNIVQGIDAGHDKGYYYFAMEFVEGETLRRIMSREGPLPEQRCIEIGLQIARALEEAHRSGMVHRDVKPENILIESSSGVPKLADLGLAKSVVAGDTSVTQVGTALGTPNYISPEQARGEQQIDIRTDIYSLGATLYHAATDTAPFSGTSAPVIMGKHISEPLEPPQRRNPNISPRFSHVIQKMMAKKPDERYQTPAKLIGDLERLLRGEMPAAELPRPLPMGRAAAIGKSIRGLSPKVKAAVAIGGGLLAAALIVALIVISQPRSSGRPDSRKAQARTHYAAATELAVREPRNFVEITNQLKQCIELDPAGPDAENARLLMETVESFDALTRVPVKNPGDWGGAAAAMRRLADKAPANLPYGKSILNFVRETSREHMTRARREAISDPARIPQSMRWLDAVSAAAIDPEIAKEAAENKGELAKLLGKSADYIMDKFKGGAEKAADEKMFSQAIAALRSGIPADLMTPQLRELLDRKIADLHKAAAGHAGELKQLLWAALDRGDLAAARTCAARARQRLDLPELREQVDSLNQTAELADQFLPLTQSIEMSEAAKDEKAAVAEAVKLKQRFGADPYVASRLKKYEAAIAELDKRLEVSQKFQAAAQLAEQKKYDEADAVIDEILATPNLTDARRRKAVQMRVEFGPEYGLIRALAAALEPRLPVDNVRLALPGRPEPLICKLVSVSKKSIGAETPLGKTDIPWNTLGNDALFSLA